MQIQESENPHSVTILAQKGRKRNPRRLRCNRQFHQHQNSETDEDRNTPIKEPANCLEHRWNTEQIREYYPLRRSPSTMRNNNQEYEIPGYRSRRRRNSTRVPLAGCIRTKNRLEKCCAHRRDATSGNQNPRTPYRRRGETNQKGLDTPSQVFGHPW